MFIEIDPNEKREWCGIDSETGELLFSGKDLVKLAGYAREQGKQVTWFRGDPDTYINNKKSV